MASICGTSASVAMRIIEYLLWTNFSLRAAKAVQMQNEECKMQNDGVGYADLFKSFPQEIPQFCTLHFEFCISSGSATNSNQNIV
jgi:hypothetical protein